MRSGMLYCTEHGIQFDYGTHIVKSSDRVYMCYVLAERAVPIPVFAEDPPIVLQYNNILYFASLSLYMDKDVRLCATAEFNCEKSLFLFVDMLAQCARRSRGVFTLPQNDETRALQRFVPFLPKDDMFGIVVLHPGDIMSVVHPNGQAYHVHHLLNGELEILACAREEVIA